MAGVPTNAWKGSEDARRMASAENSTANKALKSLRQATPTTLWAAALMTGALSSDESGLGQLTASGGFDIFAAAASAKPAGNNPYNNWLTNEAKPLWDVYPSTIGVYFGNFGDEVDDVISALVENCLLTLKRSTATIMVQPVITMPSHLALDRKPATTKDNTTVITEFFGARSPQMMMKFSDGVVFEKDKQLQCLLQAFGELPTYIAALTGNFPTQGGVIGIEITGTIGLEVGPQR